MKSEQRLFITEWFSNYVLSTFYELHLKKPKEKENKTKIRTKLKTLQAKIYNSEHLSALNVIPEMHFDVILYTSFLPPSQNEIRN